ncbi:hypothetical protein [Paenibacillus sp. SI8]|uniref:hypothetical protein n=1 Tax=unclassified Paenibacillus TaxID=185978 RepID=UPI0034675273
MTAIKLYEEFILNIKEGDEEVIYLQGKPFVITPATEDDVERIGKGYFCMD